MNRDLMIERVFDDQKMWDMVVVGGGATGLGVALDAASRGYEVCLIEQADFGKGTSSRSTKLIHGGVRYLQQGNIALVMEALKERGILLRNAPHLVHHMPFIVPIYKWWERFYYGVGLKIYDLLAGRYSFGRSRWLSASETCRLLPGLSQNGLRGGILYLDGQFDDTRLLINLAQTAVEQGATLLNYCACVGMTKNTDGVVDGAIVRDLESECETRLAARVVINATGSFCDALRRMDDPEAEIMIAPSQGVHLVLDGRFLANETAMMVPRTSDGRVLFAIPWHGRTVIGTTDTPITQPELEPEAKEEEVTFILDTASSYLEAAPRREDVLSVFTGIRPLVKAGNGAHTAQLSRDHTLHVSSSRLLTITGGKWTTYRSMAESCVEKAIELGGFEHQRSGTEFLNIHGHHVHASRFGALSMYGSDARHIQQLGEKDPSLNKPLHPSLSITGAQVIWAVRAEMAQTIEDVLSRRTRALLLDARAAVEVAPAVARLMVRELGRDGRWEEEQVRAFTMLAGSYTA